MAIIPIYEVTKEALNKIAEKKLLQATRIS